MSANVQKYMCINFLTRLRNLPWFWHPYISFQKKSYFMWCVASIYVFANFVDCASKDSNLEVLRDILIMYKSRQLFASLLPKKKHFRGALHFSIDTHKRNKRGWLWRVCSLAWNHFPPPSTCLDFSTFFFFDVLIEENLYLCREETFLIISCSRWLYSQTTT